MEGWTPPQTDSLFVLCWFPGGSRKTHIPHLPKANRPFDLLVFPWSIFSKGPKRLTFYLQVFWACLGGLPTSTNCIRASEIHVWPFVGVLLKCCGNLLTPSLAVEPKLLNLEDLVLSRGVSHGGAHPITWPHCSTSCWTSPQNKGKVQGKPPQFLTLPPRIRQNDPSFPTREFGQLT